MSVSHLSQPPPIGGYHRAMHPLISFKPSLSAILNTLEQHNSVTSSAAHRQDNSVETLASLAFSSQVLVSSIASRGGHRR